MADTALEKAKKRLAKQMAAAPAEQPIVDDTSLKLEAARGRLTRAASGEKSPQGGSEQGWGEWLGSFIPEREDVSPALSPKSLAMDDPVGVVAAAKGVPLPGYLSKAISVPQQAMTGLLDTFRNKDEREGDGVSATSSGVTAGIDALSLGSLDKAMAVVDTGLKLESGLTDADEIDADLAEALDQRQLENREIMEANSGVSLVSSIAGSVLTGGLIAKGAFGVLSKYAPAAARGVGKSWLGRVSFGAGTGGLEAGAYRLNKDGTLKEAAVDSGLAMLGGLAVGGLIETALGTGRIIFNKASKSMVDESIGNEIVEAINIDRQMQMPNAPPVTASEVADEIAKLGPGATLMDAFPSLKEFAKQILSNKDAADTAGGLRRIIATRNDLMRDLADPDGVVKEALGTPVVRNVATFTRDMGERFKRLQPKYNAAYEAAADARIPIKQTIDELDTLLGSPERRSEPAKQVFARITRLLDEGAVQAKGPDGKPLFKNSPIKGSSGAPQMGPDGRPMYKKTPVMEDGLTLERAQGIIETIDNWLDGKVVNAAGKKKDITVSLDNKLIRDLVQTRDLIRGKMDLLSPELERLNSVYGNLAKTKRAYKAGASMFSNNKEDLDAVELFMEAPNRSKAELRGFTEGAKQSILRMLRQAKNPEQIDRVLTDNAYMLRKLEALMGKDAVEAMVASVKPKVIMAQTAKELKKVTKNLAPADRDTTFGKSIDIGTAIGGVPGLVSKAGALGALRRLFGQSADAATETAKRSQTADILAATGDQAAGMFKSIQDMLAQPANPSQRSQIGRMGAASGAASEFLNMQSPE